MSLAGVTAAAVAAQHRGSPSADLAGSGSPASTAAPFTVSTNEAGSSGSVPSTPAPSSAAATPSKTAAKPPVHRVGVTKRPSSPSHGATTGTSRTPAAGSGGGPVNRAAIGYDPSRDSAADIATAMKQAKADGREVLLDFGATWCGNCQAIDRLYAESSVKKVLAAHYHLVQIDIGEKDNSTNMNLLSRYDSSGSFALPVMIVVTPGGTVRTDTNKTGLPELSTSGFTAWLNKWA
ncbi:MAG TPA: thioredoxin family protein [Streptomyces sp.]